METFFKRVAILAPHTDDGELGLGATINQMVTLGIHVKYFAFSSAYESLLDQSEGDVLVNELMQATSVLGLQRSDVEVFKFQVRLFPEKRQEILDKLIKIRQEFRPDTVFIPALNDVHQDHTTVSEEALRAFKYSNLIGYELPWNNFQLKPQLNIEISKDSLERKVEALRCYKS
jgi:N-acetylglucosamine malate deacetylase 1